MHEERDLPKAVASPVLQRITRCWESLATAHTLPISGRQDPGWVGARVTDQASWNPDLVKSVLMRAESRAPNYFITIDANLDAADPVAGIAVIEAGSLFSDGRRGKVFSGDRASKGVNNSDAVIDAVAAGSGVAVIGLTVDPDAISSDLERPVQKGVSPSLANNGYDDNGSLPSSGSFHRDSEDDITTGAIRVAADQVTAASSGVRTSAVGITADAFNGAADHADSSEAVSINGPIVDSGPSCSNLLSSAPPISTTRKRAFLNIYFLTYDQYRSSFLISIECPLRVT